MEIIQTSISAKNSFMKKVLIPLVLLVLGKAVNAQSDKKEPAPPPPPQKEVVKFKPPVITAKGKKADEFYISNPSVSEISRQGKIITIKKKDGSIEKYDVNSKEEIKTFSEKYGESPLPPPPPSFKKVS
jgi:hypothetical protein